MTKPPHELIVVSTSRASDGAYLAMMDVAAVAAEMGVQYRIVGGNAVTLLTAVHRVDQAVPGRETADADFGAGRLVTNQPHGDLVVDEVPGLALAIARPATTIALHVTLTSGIRRSAIIDLPDVVSALCLKAYAYKGRMEPRDAVDIWRLLEAAHAAGLAAEEWPPGVTAQEAGRILEQHFTAPTAAGPRSATNSPAQQARIRTLAVRMVRSH